jgi:hypothetical protein
MPGTLLQRIGADTIEELEKAAAHRQSEAARLLPPERRGALYLSGYVIEIRLKCACYRLAAVPDTWNLDSPQPGHLLSPRREAENQIKALLGVTAPKSVGHHLDGWVRLLIQTRASSTLGPFPARFAKTLNDHVQKAALHWKEILRYHGNLPYHHEVTAAAAAAEWLTHNYATLWS